RFSRDWSSDVCSSDLDELAERWKIDAVQKRGHGEGIGIGHRGYSPLQIGQAKAGATASSRSTRLEESCATVARKRGCAMPEPRKVQREAWCCWSWSAAS